MVQVQYLGLAPDTILKFYTGLKPRVRKFWGLTLKFAEVTEEKRVERRGVGGLAHQLLSCIGLSSKTQNLLPLPHALRALTH